MAQAATYFHIPATSIGLTYDEKSGAYANTMGAIFNNETIAKLLTAAVREKAMPVKRGDLIGLNPNTLEGSYCNEGIFLYDDKEVVTLDSDLAALPRSLQVTDTEFSPHYWRDVMIHNNIFWLAQPIIERMKVHWDEMLRLHIGSTKIGRATYTFLVQPRSEKEMMDALDGKPVEPTETAAEIEAGLCAGKYYFELNHGDLACIDLELQADRRFYAILMPAEEEDIYDSDEERAAVCEYYNECFGSPYYA